MIKSNLYTLEEMILMDKIPLEVWEKAQKYIYHTKSESVWETSISNTTFLVEDMGLYIGDIIKHLEKLNA